MRRACSGSSFAAHALRRGSMFTVCVILPPEGRDSGDLCALWQQPTVPRSIAQSADNMAVALLALVLKTSVSSFLAHAQRSRRDGSGAGTRQRGRPAEQCASRSTRTSTPADPSSRQWQAPPPTSVDRTPPPGQGRAKRLDPCSAPNPKGVRSRHIRADANEETVPLRSVS